MSADATILEAHHDDGLDIDFDLGAPQSASTPQVPAQLPLAVEQDLLGSKPDAIAPGVEAGSLGDAGRAPSEINYDSDGDACYSKEEPLHIVHDNDEITWDDADDGAEDKQAHSPVTHGSIDLNVDTSDVADGASLQSSVGLAANDLEDISTGDVVSGELETVPEEQCPPAEDDEHELENPEGQGEEQYEDGGHQDASFERQEAEEYEDPTNGHEEEANIVEHEDEEYEEDVDETMAVDVGGDEYASREDSDDTGSSVPEVQVQFAGNSYSLFRDPYDNNKPYILEDSLFQARASELLDALHDALGDEISDGDELVVQVQELCLEISPMMASTLQSMSISDFAHLHAKLVANDESQESHPLRLTIVSKPAFSTRYQELLAGVKQGIGLSQLSRQFDAGQGVLYSSPIKNDLGDIEYPDDDAEYDQSAEDVDDEDVEEVSNEDSLAGDDNGDVENMTDQASDEADHDGDMQEDGDDEYYDQEETGEEAVYAEEDDHPGGADYSNDELMDEYSAHPGDDTQYAAQEEPITGVHTTDGSHVASNSVGDEAGLTETARMSEAAAGGGHADTIDWVDDEPNEDGAQDETAHDMNSSMDAPATAAQDAAAATSRQSTPSVTIDGDNDGENDVIELQVDVGLGAEETSAVDENPSKPPAVDEISWEGDDDEEVGDEVPEPQTSNLSANVNGKRQHPGDKDELHEGDGAVDFKRRRSS